MKKLLCLLLSLLLLCPAALSLASPLRIGVMSGPTGMGMAALMNAQDDRYSFDVYAAPTDATADLASGTLDLLCLPTNTAASLSLAKQDFIQVLAVNCLGTLYLVTDAEAPVFSLQDLQGVALCAGVPSSTTAPILQRLFENAGVEPALEWEADHDGVIARMLRGEIHAAVLPEPKVTVALNRAEGWQVALNLSTLWQDAFASPLPMGCIVARCETIEHAGDATRQFLADYAASIETISNPENRAQSAAMIVSAGILPAEGVALKSLANLESSLVYMDGEAMRAALEAFYALIGQKQPDASFYYHAQ